MENLFDQICVATHHPSGASLLTGAEVHNYSTNAVMQELVLVQEMITTMTGT